jgi:hypothetical protein
LILDLSNHEDTNNAKEELATDDADKTESNRLSYYLRASASSVAEVFFASCIRGYLFLLLD